MFIQRKVLHSNIASYLITDYLNPDHICALYLPHSSPLLSKNFGIIIHPFSLSNTWLPFKNYCCYICINNIYLFISIWIIIKKKEIAVRGCVKLCRWSLSPDGDKGKTEMPGWRTGHPSAETWAWSRPGSRERLSVLQWSSWRVRLPETVGARMISAQARVLQSPQSSVCGVLMGSQSCSFPLSLRPSLSLPLTSVRMQYMREELKKNCK